MEVFEALVGDRSSFLIEIKELSEGSQRIAKQQTHERSDGSTLPLRCEFKGLETFYETFVVARLLFHYGRAL
jgi:hypothetical protein